MHKAHKLSGVCPAYSNTQEISCVLKHAGMKHTNETLYPGDLYHHTQEQSYVEKTHLQLIAPSTIIIA